MEYPMATLITGERKYSSLVGVSIHEWMHAWYHTVLATNESLYSWMDEGFTSFASAEVMNYLRKKKMIPGKVKDNPHTSKIKSFANWASSGYDEPLTTHADHFTINQAFSVASYTKGAVFLTQLSYIMGEENFYKGLKRYFNDWKFKHPNPNDFIRVMEKQSGLELDWYKEYWVGTTKTIDYAIGGIREHDGQTIVDLYRKGLMPMPLDVSVTLMDGTQKHYYIPLRIMRGEKGQDMFSGELQRDWPWTHAHYELKTDLQLNQVVKVEIDQSTRFSDIDFTNNIWPQEMPDDYEESGEN